jgi:tetratricopeptide (TPR) repeat protein
VAESKATADAADTNPEARAHCERALGLEREGRYEEAAAEYREAGILLRELGQDDEANRAFEAALAARRRGRGSGKIAP